MEKIVKISASQKVTSDDLSEIGTFGRESLDHAVKDGVEPNRGYTGFNTVKTSQTVVTVGAGRYYNQGAIFFNSDEGGVTLDFLSDLPALYKRYAAVVVAGQAIDTQTEAREFLLNAATGQTEARVTSTENWRRSSVSYVLGNENATPSKFTVDSQYLVVAWVLLDTTSVVSIEMNEDTRLKSARDAFNLADLLSSKFDLVFWKLAALENDLARLATLVNQSGDSEMVYRLAADVARLKEDAGLPDTYVDYGNDVFLDEVESDKTETGYNAKVQEGLRFPPVAGAPVTSVLTLLNPLDANIYKDPTGLILPSWKDTRVRWPGGLSGNIAMNSVAFDSSSILISTMIQTRARLGDEFEVSSSSSWWGTARYLDGTNGFLTKDGQTFQTYPTNRYNPDGSKIVRVRKVWTDTVTGSQYWNRVNTPDTVAGFKLAQTFLNSQDKWMTGIGLSFARRDTSGPVTALICETLENGQPNEQKVIAKTIIAVSDIVLDLNVKYPITPTFLEQGKQYACILSTAGNHWINTSDVTGTQNGNLFFKTGAGYWQADPAKSILFDIWYAEFDRPRTEVQMGSLSLAGGIASLDMIAQQIVPAAAGLVWEVQVAGVWTPLTAEQMLVSNPFSTLPTTVPLRAVFTGGSLAQPGIILTSSQVKVSRPSTALKHFSSTRTTPSATTSVRTISRIENYTSAKHTITPKVKVAGTEYTASLVKDRIIDSKTIERTAFFTVPSTTTYKRVTIGATTDAADLCVVASVTDVAT